MWSSTLPLMIPRSSRGIKIENSALLITVQKAAPLILISYLIEMNIFH
jgi:hypothetical protein